MFYVVNKRQLVVNKQHCFDDDEEKRAVKCLAAGCNKVF
jgi:hypothetical protein